MQRTRLEDLSEQISGLRPQGFQSLGLGWGRTGAVLLSSCSCSNSFRFQYEVPGIPVNEGFRKIAYSEAYSWKIPMEGPSTG